MNKVYIKRNFGFSCFRFTGKIIGQTLVVVPYDQSSWSLKEHTFGIKRSRPLLKRKCHKNNLNIGSDRKPAFGEGASPDPEFQSRKISGSAKEQSMIVFSTIPLAATLSEIPG